MTQPPDLSHETQLWKAFPLIGGLDEAGRGALAGPVCVGAVILPNDNPHLSFDLKWVRDSKQLTPLKRSQLTPLVKRSALAWGIGFSSPEEIDAHGIVPSTKLAAYRAIEALSKFPNYLLTDFRLELPEIGLSQTSLVKGDQRSLSIAAASILAKTARDEFMVNLHAQYPAYGFNRHKGYGTLAHRQAIARQGQSTIHRKSFAMK